jgi:peptidoglycan/xylan/chitin deacetylase (PgdA/CDA1 family)
VVDQAYPGAIVLFHDGGGDQSQTVEALGTILETLSEQGYVFEVVCP